MTRIIGRGRYACETYPATGPSGPGGGPPDFTTVNRINTGNLGGSKLVDVDCTNLKNGSVASVYSVGALFTLTKTPSAQLLAAVDGINVVASTATPGAIWVRGPTTGTDRFASNPPAFIDPVNGNDDNDGLSGGVNALKSGPEFCRRLNNCVLPASVTVACAAGNIGPISLNYTCASGIVAKITFDGTAAITSSAAGTIGLFVAQNPVAAANADGVRSEFTDAGAPAIAVNSRLRLTSGAHVGAITYVTGYHAGATNPYTQQWALPGAAATSLAVPVNPSNGDAYVVDTLNATIQLVIADATSLGFAQFVVKNMLVHSLNTGFHQLTGSLSSWNSAPCAFWLCVFQDATETGFLNCNLTLTQCDFQQPVVITQCVLTHNSCVFRNGYGNFQSTVVFQGDTVFNTVPVGHQIAYFSHNNGQASQPTGSNIQWCGCTGGSAEGIVLTASTGWDEFGTQWGANNTFVVGFDIASRASATYQIASQMNIPATTQFRIGFVNYGQADLPVSAQIATQLCGLIVGTA